MTFRENVAIIRKIKDFSQDELSKKVGIIGITISRYKRDEIKPSIDVATKIANLAEVSMVYLVGHSDTILEKSLVKKLSDTLLYSLLHDHQTKKTYTH
jgi:transcriptional regulator with XRE-family HTH domain